MKTYHYILIAAVLLIGGYFAYKKFGVKQTKDESRFADQADIHIDELLKLAKSADPDKVRATYYIDADLEGTGCCYTATINGKTYKISEAAFKAMKEAGYDIFER